MGDPHSNPLNDWWQQLRPADMTAFEGDTRAKTLVGVLDTTPTPAWRQAAAMQVRVMFRLADPGWPRFGLFWPWTRKARRG